MCACEHRDGVAELGPTRVGQSRPLTLRQRHGRQVAHQQRAFFITRLKLKKEIQIFIFLAQSTGPQAGLLIQGNGCLEVSLEEFCECGLQSRVNMFVSTFMLNVRSRSAISYRNQIGLSVFLDQN